MRRRLLALLSALLLSSIPASAQPTPDRTVWTADDLHTAGVTRLGDLLPLLDGWTASTTEGFTWRASAGALAPLQASSWQLFVDGLPVDLGLLGASNPNLLPVALTAVDSVEVWSRPVMIGGVLAPAGALHVHTRRPTARLAASSLVGAANEVGDPGPFRYTDFATENIDRIGPTLHADASVRARGGYLRPMLVLDEHHATDARLEDRVRVRYQENRPPRLLLRAPGVDAAWGTHRAFGGFVRLHDLRFLEPYGLEVPVTQRLVLGGVRGLIASEASPRLHYMLSGRIADLDPRFNATGFGLDFRQQHVRGTVEAQFSGQIEGAVGVSAEHLRSIAPQPLVTSQLLIPALYGRLQATRGRLHASAAAQGLVADGALGGALLTSLSVRAGIHRLALHGAVHGRPYALQNTLWYWLGEGFRLPELDAATIRLPEAFSNGTTLALDASWTLQPAPQLSIRLGGGYRRFLGQTLADYSFAYDPATDGFATEVSVVPFVSGQAARGSVQVRWQSALGIVSRLAYHYTRIPGVDLAFYRAWSSLPWHQASYTARYAVAGGRFTLYGRLGYQSSTLWPAFGQAATATADRYPERLPATWLLDVTAQKRFWGDRVRTNLSLRNLLNRPLQQHPAGAVTDLVLHVAVEVSVGD